MEPGAGRPGEQIGFARKRHSMRPPRLAVYSLILVVITFAVVWAAVTAAVEYGAENCPNQAGGTGATGCR